MVKDLARWLKATADETRLRILYLLSTHGELCVCDIHETLGISQSRASRHLRTLREAHLVDDRRVGMWMRYRVRTDLEPHREELLSQLVATLEKQEEAAVLDRKLATWLKTKRAREECA